MSPLHMHPTTSLFPWPHTTSSSKTILITHKITHTTMQTSKCWWYLVEKPGQCCDKLTMGLWCSGIVKASKTWEQKRNCHSDYVERQITSSRRNKKPNLKSIYVHIKLTILKALAMVPQFPLPCALFTLHPLFLSFYWSNIKYTSTRKQ